MAPRGRGTYEYTLNWTVIFAPRSLKLCLVLDIELTDKLGTVPKGVWHLGGVGTHSIFKLGAQNHKIDHNSLNFKARSSIFHMAVHIDTHKKYF